MNDVYVQNFLRNLTLKEFCKSEYICGSYDEKSSVLFFFDSPCRQPQHGILSLANVTFFSRKRDSYFHLAASHDSSVN